MIYEHRIALRLAALLFLGYGRITLSEIMTLPFVESQEQALFIAQRLLDAFKADGHIVEVDTDGYSPEATLRLVGRKAKSRAVA